MIKQVPATRTKKGSLSSTTIVVIAVFVMLVGVLLISTIKLVNSADNSTDVKAPHSIGNMTTTRVTTGEQAINEMSKLHGKGVGVVGGYIAYYQGSGGTQAIVWVGQAENEGQAQRLNEAMTERIGPGNSYFMNPKTQKIGVNYVYSLDGSDGLKHYYYQKGNKVIWVGIKVSRPDETIREFVATEW